MKKIWKRSIAIVLIAITVLSYMLIEDGADVFASDTLFQDNFATAVSERWQNQSAGKVSDGKYVLDAGMSNYVKGIPAEGNYIVSADVSMIYDASAGKAGFVSVVSKANADMTTGYEFGIGATKTGSTFARLYRIGSDGKEEILRQASTDIAGIGKIKKKNTYNIKLGIYGNRIICLIDGNVFADITDSTYTSGYMGLHADGIGANYDNFMIQKMPEMKVEKLELVSHSTTVAPMEKLCFEIDVVYNSVYGKERINQDTIGTNVFGYDATPGEKSIRVSYMDKVAKFSVTVQDKYTAETLWNDEFTEDNLKKKYSGGSYTNNTYNFTYKFTVKDGKAYVKWPNLNGGDVAATATLAINNSEMKEWDRYSINTTATIHSDSTSPSKRYGQAGIVFAKANGSNYTYRICTDGNIYIQLGTTKLQTVKLSDVGLSVSHGKKVDLRVDMHGDYAEFYCNSKKVSTLWFTKKSVMKNAGLIAVNGEDSFENIQVYSLMERSKYTLKKVSVVDAKGAVVSHVKSKSLYAETLFVKAEYADGFCDYVLITEDMISGYNPSLTSQTVQAIIVRYGKTKMNLKYTYTPYLFYDDFSAKTVSSKWVLTPLGTQTHAATIENQKLHITYPKGYKDGTNSYYMTTVDGGSDWTDYSVSADIYIEDIYNSKDRNIAITARQNGMSRYEFRWVYMGTEIRGRLYKYIGNSGRVIGEYKQTMMNGLLEEGKRVAISQTFNFKLSVRGNCIQTYLDGVLVDTYYDMEDNALTKGTAGIYLVNNSVLIDNFIVEEHGAMDIKSIGIANNPQNVIELYEGQDISAWKEKIEVIYEDGSKEQYQLLPEMVSDFDNTALGKQKVTVTYQGVSDTFYVNITERTKYLDTFSEQVKKFDKEVTKSNLEDFYELQEIYNDLSNYEIEQLDNSVQKKYNELYQSMEYLLYPEVKDSELLYDGYLDKESAKSWTDGREMYVGEWAALNDMFYHIQRPYRSWGTGYRAPDVYGEINMISADIKMLSQMMYAGIILNWSENGYYQLRVNSSGVDSEGRQTFQLQFGIYDGAWQNYAASCFPADYGIEIKDNEWFNLCLTAKDGKINAYVNGILLLQYDDALGACHVEGQCAARVSEGDALVDNIRVYGKAIEQLEQKVEIEPTYYKDDFEDETVGQNPSHWTENTEWNNLIDNWKVVSKNGSKVYGTALQEKYSSTYLHVFEKDPEYTVRFMAEQIAEKGTFGFLTRMSPETAYVKIGYDASTSKWYICSQKAESAGETWAYSKNTFAVNKGVWYTAQIKEEGAKVSLYINDKLIVETENAVETSPGRLGFYVEGASMYVDEVECTFANGDVPQDGVISYDVHPEGTYTYMEVEAIAENTLMGMAASKKFLSTDAGVTWSDVTKAAEWEGFVCAGFYKSVIQLHDGKWLQIRTQASTKGVLQEDDLTAWTSDDFKTWKKLGRVIHEEDETMGPTNLNNPILHVSTMCEVQLEDGTWRIFCPMASRIYKGTAYGMYTVIYYSDDGGVTWNKAKNDTRSVLPGAEDDVLTSWSESKIVQGSDGVLRLYMSRNHFGCIVYTESYDGGLTWENMIPVPELQCAMSSFGVYEDPTEPGTYYMVWVNSTDGYYRKSMYPRTRLCLAKSTDGKTWKFLTNIEWMGGTNSPFNGVPLYQCLDPSVMVTEDYVYVMNGRSSREDSLYYPQSHQLQDMHYTRIEKDKLTEREWDATTLCNVDYPVKIEYETMPQTKYGLGDLFALGNDITLKITGLSGREYTQRFKSNATVHGEPNMFKLGKQTVQVTYKNGYDLSYEVEIVPNYKLTWIVSDGGVVVNQMKRLMEGATQEFELDPDAGYRVQYVKINGEKVSVKKNKFTVEHVKEDLEIEVLFSQKTLLDYWPIMLSTVLLIGIGAYVGLAYMKKKKKNAVETAVADVPPADGGI